MHTIKVAKFPVIPFELEFFLAHLPTKSPNANKSVAKPSNQGIIYEKTLAGVMRSNKEPPIPPMIDSIINNRNLDFGYSFNSLEKPKAPLKYPGNTATALVAFAAIVGTPVNTNAGNVRKLPPPAIEFIIPATNEADASRESSKIVILKT